MTKQDKKKTKRIFFLKNTHFNLWLLPLVDVRLFDLKVNPFNAIGAALDLDAAQVRLEVVQHTLCLGHEALKSEVNRV